VYLFGKLIYFGGIDRHLGEMNLSSEYPVSPKSIVAQNACFMLLAPLSRFLTWRYHALQMFPNK